MHRKRRVAAAMDAEGLPADVSGRGLLGLRDGGLDGPPFLARSESAVDSGYSGHDAEEADTISTCSSSSGASSSYCGSVSGIKDLVHHAAHSAASPLHFEGDINVEHSTVQFGNNTHYHGPVTVLLSSGKPANGKVVPAAVLPSGTVSSDSVVLAAAALSASAVASAKDEQNDLGPPSPASPPARGANDIKALLAGLALNEPARCRRCPPRPSVVAGAFALVVVLLTTSVIAFVLPQSRKEPPKVAPVQLPNGLTVVPRDQWLAQPPKDGVDPLTTRVDYVIIHHSATEPCFNMPECILRARYVQMFHMESRNWSDIGYNFMVGGDGYVYVGRGWEKVGAHTFNWNNRSIGICLLGTFTYQRPTNEQMSATTKLIEYGVRLGRLAPHYKLAGVCQLRSTESPGRLVYEDIRRWGHWWNYTTGDSNCR